ncbi:MAG: SUMF1/EgtB/PvdO family nonheme iron enzyme [Gemmataceae bacterium]
MSYLDGILRAIREVPTDPTAWLALADCLEEANQPERAELVRLQRALPQERGARRRASEDRIRLLLRQGVRPCHPTWQGPAEIELALLPPGRFRMGSPVREWRRMNDEPLHDVTLARPFYMSMYPITQEQYREVMGGNPSCFTPAYASCAGQDVEKFPVESVPWELACEFCEVLNRLEHRLPHGLIYRLPTEAEWEYACRAGMSVRHPFSFGPELTSALANFNAEYPYPSRLIDDGPGPLERPTPVGSYAPNGFGLFDMHGNIDEWVQDWFDDEYYLTGPSVDPPGPAEGEGKVIRGGSWSGQGEDCRAAVRIGQEPDLGDNKVGFRIVLGPPLRE